MYNKFENFTKGITISRKSRKTDKTVVKIKLTMGNTMIYKTQHIEHKRSSSTNLTTIGHAPKGYAVLLPRVVPVVLLL